MASQFVVVFFPTPALVAEAVGPFRSQQRANEVRDQLEAQIEREDYGLAPQVVSLDTVAGVVREYGPEPEPSDS